MGKGSNSKWGYTEMSMSSRREPSSAPELLQRSTRMKSGSHTARTLDQMPSVKPPRTAGIKPETARSTVSKCLRERTPESTQKAPSRHGSQTARASKPSAESRKQVHSRQFRQPSSQGSQTARSSMSRQLPVQSSSYSRNSAFCEFAPSPTSVMAPKPPSRRSTPRSSLSECQRASRASFVPPLALSRAEPGLDADPCFAPLTKFRRRVLDETLPMSQRVTRQQIDHVQCVPPPVANGRPIGYITHEDPDFAPIIRHRRGVRFPLEKDGVDLSLIHRYNKRTSALASATERLH